MLGIAILTGRLVAYAASLRRSSLEVASSSPDGGSCTKFPKLKI